ncbi:MAG: hypothetical protein V1936_03080 [Patescibacteria group bacterium]
MFFRHKKNSDNRLALLLSGLAFFTVMSVYAVVKLDATMHRPRELPLVAIGGESDFIEPISESSATAEPTQPAEISDSSNDEQSWTEAEATLVKFFEEINSGNYTSAAALRNPKFLVGSVEAYAAQLRNSMKNDISGQLKITEIERVANESKPTTKVFRFRKDAIWSFDGATHSEIRKAALVLRDGKWSIDYFKVERKF